MVFAMRASSTNRIIIINIIISIIIILENAASSTRIRDIRTMPFTQKASRYARVSSICASARSGAQRARHIGKFLALMLSIRIRAREYRIMHGANTGTTTECHIHQYTRIPFTIISSLRGARAGARYARARRRVKTTLW